MHDALLIIGLALACTGGGALGYLLAMRYEEKRKGPR